MPSVSISDTKSDPTHGSTVTATAIADFGRLGAYALAFPPSGSYIVGPPGHQFSYPDAASATAHAEFDDTLTVAGPTGVLTGVVFTAVLSGFILPNPSWGHVDLLTFVDNPAEPVIRNSYPNAMTGATILLRPAGSSLHLHVDLSLRVGAGSTGFMTSAIGDFVHTARLYADVDTPGFSLVSSSGHDYSAAAIPEPSTYLLMVAGLAVVARGTKRGYRTRLRHAA
jgi:hypothetical protein